MVRRGRQEYHQHVLDGCSRFWSVGTGRLAYVLESRDGMSCSEVFWNFDGTVRTQVVYDSTGNVEEKRLSSPWLRGVTDQTSPSIQTWMQDDEKWAKALEEAR